MLFWKSLIITSLLGIGSMSFAETNKNNPIEKTIEHSNSGKECRYKKPTLMEIKNLLEPLVRKVSFTKLENSCLLLNMRYHDSTETVRQADFINSKLDEFSSLDNYSGPILELNILKVSHNNSNTLIEPPTNLLEPGDRIRSSTSVTHIFLREGVACAIPFDDGLFLVSEFIIEDESWGITNPRRFFSEKANFTFRNNILTEVFHFNLKKVKGIRLQPLRHHSYIFECGDVN